MSSSYIGRQPIVDIRGSLLAYDLLSPQKLDDSDENATSSLINNLQSAFGIDRILGKRLGFIRVDHRFILHGLLGMLPKERVVYALVENTEVTPELAARLRELRSEGFRFAINDFAFTDENVVKFSPLFPYLEFVKIDMIRSGRIKRDDVARLKALGLNVIGSKIESHDIHAECSGKGFGYFEGYFISKPKTLQNTSFSVEQAAVIHLWNLLREDVSIDELVQEFEKNHMVSLKLLRFINSAVFSLRHPVSSIRHVLTLLGREPLKQWLMLLMFSENEGSDYHSIPLLLMVVNRTELMTKLVDLVVPNPTKKERDTAYFVGMLSLIHLLFQMPHREILRKLNVEPQIERALFEGDGFYGELLSAVRSIEMMDVEGIERFLEQHGFDYPVLEPIIAEAMEKVNQFDEIMG